MEYSALKRFNNVNILNTMELYTQKWLRWGEKCKSDTWHNIDEP